MREHCYDSRIPGRNVRIYGYNFPVNLDVFNLIQRLLPSEFAAQSDEIRETFIVACTEVACAEML